MEVCTSAFKLHEQREFSPKNDAGINFCKWYEIVEVIKDHTLKLSLFKLHQRKKDGKEIKIFVNNGLYHKADWHRVGFGDFGAFFPLENTFFRHVLFHVWMASLSWRALQPDWTCGGQGDMRESERILKFYSINLLHWQNRTDSSERRNGQL